MKTLKLTLSGASLIMLLGLMIGLTMGSVSASEVDQGSEKMSAGVKPSPSKEKTASNKLLKLTKALDLSSDQQQKIRPILEQESAQIKALRADKSLSKSDHLAKVREIHKDSKSKIQALLNPDQQKKLAEMGPGRKTSQTGKG